jgi:CheY-like chemotaxis protein
MKGMVAAVNTLVLKGLHVLVVDDEEDSQTLLAFMLEMQGAEVTTVASAESAYQLLSDRQPDLLLCDIAMPDEDGYSLMRRIRSLAGKSGQIPAIAVSALASEVSLAESMAAGFQAYISKPVDFDELIETVLRVCPP